MKSPNIVILSFDVDGQRVFDFFDKSGKDILLEDGLPKAVEFLKSNNLDATFFTVGKNIIDFPNVHEKLKEFEIGNHTFSHPYFLTKKTFSEKEFEIKKAHSVIEDFYGITPKMFRAPDYQIDGDIIAILKGMGYRGDSSVVKVLIPFYLKYCLNYYRQRDIAKDPFEFPLTSFLLPFNGTTAIFYGFELTRLIFEYLLKFNKVININFHERDFVNIKINQAGFWRRERSLETTLKFLNYMHERCDILSFRQYFDRQNA